MNIHFGTRVKTIKFGNVNLSGVEARTLFGLKSTNFTVKIDNEKVKFEVIGYGHGVRNESNRGRQPSKRGKGLYRNNKSLL